MSDIIHVAAGIVRNDRGEILIAKRGATKHNAHMWEFPGGKLEKGETPAQALSRELEEELSLEISGAKEVHRENEGNICLHFLTACGKNAPVCREHDEIRFVEQKDIGTFAFSPADMRVAKMLALQSAKPLYFFWDYDGTLMDTYPMYVSSLKQCCLEMGAEADESRIFRLMMKTQGYAVRTIAGEHGWNSDELYQSFKQKCRENPTSPNPIEGIPGVLREIKQRGGSHFLVTHSGVKAADALEEKGLRQFFTDFVTRENNLPRKPDPAMVNYLIEKHHLPRERCIIIGDRPLDTAAGISAGIHSCLLDRFGLFPEEECDVSVTAADEIIPRVMGWD